ncbi:hypothetical protein M501DRAFT_904990, partial [Patellaria atrata CBS 101060]
WRHCVKAIYRRYISDETAQHALIESDGEEEEDEADNPFDIGFGHGSKTAEAVYGRTVDESPFSTASQRSALRKVSKRWHEFLKFQSTLEDDAYRKGKITAKIKKKEAIEGEMKRWKRLRAVNIREQLKLLVGSEAEFRSVQRPALEAIMQQKNPVVVVMGTGAGKSMLFMLPASCLIGVTVVVVPLISLRADMKARCSHAGIECVEWDSRRPQEWA